MRGCETGTAKMGDRAAATGNFPPPAPIPRVPVTLQFSPILFMLT